MSFVDDVTQNHQLLKQVLIDYELGPRQVVRANTTTDRIRDQSSLDNSRMYFRKNFRTLGHEVIENFLELKLTAVPVAEIYGEFSDLIFLTEPDLRAIFSSGEAVMAVRTGGSNFESFIRSPRALWKLAGQPTRLMVLNVS